MYTEEIVYGKKMNIITLEKNLLIEKGFTEKKTTNKHYRTIIRFFVSLRI